MTNATRNSSCFLDHPQGGTFSGLLYRMHPTKGCQYWSPLRGGWYLSHADFALMLNTIAWEDTWAEPEIEVES